MRYKELWQVLQPYQPVGDWYECSHKHNTRLEIGLHARAYTLLERVASTEEVSRFRSHTQTESNRVHVRLT